MGSANPFNRKSKIGAYLPLYELIKERIQRGEWKPGEALPAETELMAQYQVSQIAVREVVDQLIHEGLVYRGKKREIIISYPVVEANIMRVKSFTEDMLQRGLEPETVVLSAKIVSAPLEIAEKLQVEVEEPLALLRRLRYADQEPIGIEESYLVARYCPNILNQHDFSVHSLRKALEEDHGIRLVRGQQTIKAMAAPKSIADHLKIQPKSPLLYIERVTLSQYNFPIEFLRVYYRADRFVLYNEMQG